jgi:chemotaxis signal transduction protein
MADESQTAVSAAWILTLDASLCAAVGQREMVFLIETPVLLDVPLSPFYCRQAVVWKQRLLPVMDLAAWLRQTPALPRHQTLTGVFAYQTQPGAEPAYGALRLAAIPDRAHVSDDQACALPKQPPGWPTLAISCFKHNEQPIPILDLPRIFTGGLL